MLIIFRPYGNHTNQIYQFIQSDIFAKIHNLQFDCYFVYNFFSVFPNLREKYKSFKTLFVFPVLSFIFKILNRFHLINTFDVSDLKICQKIADCHINDKNLIFDKWDFKGNEVLFNNKDLFKEYRDYYKELFFIDISAIKDKYIDRKFKNIAVHIRRGDYADFRGGKFLFDNEFYCQKTKELLSLWNIEKANIIIFTNDSKIDKNFFYQSFENVCFSNEEWFIDQQLMSNCDFIIGPPSTFTMWASYIGNTPVYHIWQPNKRLLKKDFFVYTSFHPDIE